MRIQRVVGTVTALVFACVLTVGCSGAQAAKTGKASADGNVIRLKTYTCMDRDGIGRPAFRVLVPEGWTVRGGVQWRLDTPGSPAGIHLLVESPSGRAAVEILPAIPCFWTNNRGLLAYFPPGSRYFGNLVEPPVNAVEALRRMILPRYRGNVAGLKVVDERSLPGLARAFPPFRGGHPSQASGGMVQVEYRQNGTTCDERIYTIVQEVGSTVPVMGQMVTNVLWGPDYIHAYRAPKGTLPKYAKLFQTIAYSFRLDEQWYNTYSQLVNRLIQAQIQHIRSLGEISRIIAQTSDQISDENMKAYESRQRINDAMADSFDQSIRGVDAYYDPYKGRKVELPSGYDHVWANSLGGYVVSDSPDFNPNVHSNVHWEQLKKR